MQKQEKSIKQTDKAFGEITDEMIESSKSLRKTLNIVSILLCLIFVIFIKHQYPVMIFSNTIQC